jgi:hypothetical protein
MQKSIPLLVAITIIISGCAVAAVPQDTIKTDVAAIRFSSPQLSTANNYLSVTLKEMTANILIEGKPVLPTVVKVFDLPFGSQDVSIQCTVGTISEQVVTKDVQPAPKALPQIDGVDASITADQATYASAQAYPSSWFDYKVTGGLDQNSNHVTHVAVTMYPVRYLPAIKTLQNTDSMDIKVSYQLPSNPQTFANDSDMVIITAKKFTSVLQKLVDHKNAHGVRTYVMTVEDILATYDGFDAPEQIKYAIKDQIEQHGIKFVMLFGGVKNKIYVKDRESLSTGTTGWLVPARYTNVWEDLPPAVFDPGYLSDLYYSDIYTSSGAFSSWDSNHDGVYSAWGFPGGAKDIMDLDPDVYVGRLACTTTKEANIVIDKIIAYETSAAGSGDWTKKMVTISGDSFPDFPDLNIVWNTNSLTTGTYTIYAQSRGDDNVLGPIDTVNVTVDKSKPSVVTFREDDNDMGLIYPAPARAEITSPSDGDILGNTAVNFIPPDAYSGSEWAKVQYNSGTMVIRGKSYDPKPFGVNTTLHVWVKNSGGTTVFENTLTGLQVYFESEWETWHGGSFMPSGFTIQDLWASNGGLTGQPDVLAAMNEGSLFVQFAGHGNPRVWANHYPGIPGGRRNASIDGLMNTQLGLPFLPMDKLKNGGKLPIVVVGGCHNSMYNVSFLQTLLNGATMWTYGVPCFDCWSWTLIREKNGGAIGTIGSSGLGYGYQGFACLMGLGGWIDGHFFEVYGQLVDQAKTPYFGQIHSTAISDYIATFPTGGQLVDCKTVQEWALLGDPSLVIGGYAS